MTTTILESSAQVTSVWQLGLFCMELLLKHAIEVFCLDTFGIRSVQCWMQVKIARRDVLSLKVTK